jgi:hypothetical protein
MFGFCIWAELIPSHIFYTINRLLASKSNSQIHNPHITLDYDVKLKNQNILNNYKACKLTKIGEVYQTNTDNFYSLQQDYFNLSIDNDIKLYHISLAYKVDYPFTEQDINFANTLDIPAIIYPDEFEISLWNCDSVYTQRWFKINPQFQHVYLGDNADK